MLVFFKQNILLEMYLFEILKNLIGSAYFFFLWQILKSRDASAKALDAALVKLRLSTAWLLIFPLEVANKKSLFTNLAST